MAFRELSQDTRWRLAVAAGCAPVLILGFAASALANRLAFLVVAVAAALIYVLVLHRTWARPAPWPRTAPRLALALAFGAGAVLVALYREALALGIAALAPSFEPALWAAPATWALLAAALALDAVIPLFSLARRSP